MPMGFNEKLYVFLTGVLVTVLMILPLYLGYQVGQYAITSQPLNFLFGFIFLYWIFLHQQIQRTGFIVKNKVLLIILGILFIVVYPIAALVMAITIGLYMLFFYKRAYGPSSFVRYHLLMQLVSFTALLWFGVLIFSFAQLLLTLAAIGDVTSVTPLGRSILMGLCGLYGISVLSVGGILSIGGLMGKSPVLPFASRQVVYWA